jgi:osmotically-inducible protein OsmY
MFAIARTAIPHHTIVVAWSSFCDPLNGGKPYMNKPSGFLSLAGAMVLTMILVGGCSKSPETTGRLPAVSASVSNVSDIDLTEHVKTALHQNEMLKGFDINVVAQKGDIRLTGMLDNQAQADEAIKVARTADGVHAVHNELSIKK